MMRTTMIGLGVAAVLTASPAFAAQPGPVAGVLAAQPGPVAGVLAARSGPVAG